MNPKDKNQLYTLTANNLGKKLITQQKDRTLHGSEAEMIDYVTTNYLGWDFHEKMLSNGIAMHKKWGSLSGWSRLEVDAEIYPSLEKRLSSFLSCDEVILSHTITITNFSIISSIAKRGIILCDEKVHTVVWEACRLARDHGAALEKFGHQNLSHLEDQLKKHKDVSPKLICVDGVYSISSEYAPISELQELCRKYDAWLLVDDAHGFGILGKDPSDESPYGKGGSGVVNWSNGDFARTFYVTSFGKSFCTHTAFVTIPSEYARSLRESCLQYIYSAPMPPFVIGMAEASLDLNESEGDQQRRKIFNLTKIFVDGLRDIGLQVINHAYFPIVFWQIGHLQDLVTVAEKLFSAGVIGGLRAFPVVPENECGIRFGITALHTEDQIRKSIEIIKTVVKSNKVSRAA